MKLGLKKTALGVTSAFLLALALNTWAAPIKRAAHLYVDDYAVKRERRGAQAPGLPQAVRFREVEGRGLLVRIWINDAGAYTFAVDTGAGATLISERVAREARVENRRGRAIAIGGLSGTTTVVAREATVRRLAIGERDNFLPSREALIVTDRLPPGIDGVLDPTAAYWPLGYVIDLPNGELSAFDPRNNPLRRTSAPPGGAIVPWIFGSASRRPIVTLSDGRRALIDTGSGFGLAISRDAAREMGIEFDEGRAKNDVRDIAGGRITARRIAPVTVHIGSLTLRRVPTDLLLGVEAGSPILLGRDALRPFQIAFDPISRLIQFTPV